MPASQRITLPRTISDWLITAPRADEAKSRAEHFARRRLAASYVTSRTTYRSTFDLPANALLELIDLCRLALEDPAISESGKGAFLSSIRILENAASK